MASTIHFMRMRSRNPIRLWKAGKASPGMAGLYRFCHVLWCPQLKSGALARRVEQHFVGRGPLVEFGHERVALQHLLLRRGAEAVEPLGEGRVLAHCTLDVVDGKVDAEGAEDDVE